MNLPRVGALATAIVFSGLASGANPNQAEDIVKRSVANTDADWAAAPKYDFTEHDITIRNGKRTTKTYRVHMIEGSTYNKLTAVDGQPLAGGQAQEEDQKLQQEIKRRRSESSSARQQRVEKYQKERRQDHLLMSEMVKAFDYRLTGEETVNGRRCFVLQASPKPGYKPPNRDTQVLKGMRGEMWVDAEQYQWAKVHAEVFRSVSFGLFFAQVKPGTEFTLEQKPADGKIWLPTHFTMNVKARVFLSSRTSSDDEVYSDYRPAAQALSTSR
jgi:hypothetical protein